MIRNSKLIIQRGKNTADVRGVMVILPPGSFASSQLMARVVCSCGVDFEGIWENYVGELGDGESVYMWQNDHKPNIVVTM